MNDIETMSLAELREAAENAGIPSHGDKDDLINRLQQHAVSELAAQSAEGVSEGESLSGNENQSESKGRRGKARGSIPADKFEGNTTTENQQLQNKLYSAEEVQKIVASKVAEATQKLVIPSQSEVNKLLQSHSGYSEKEVQETFEYLQNRFKGAFVVRLDKHQEVFQFDGGKQGRMTTTIKQPAKAVVKIAEQYANIANAAMTWDMAVGKVGE